MLESLVGENAFRGVETIEGDGRIEGGSGWEIGSVDDESLISVIMKGGALRYFGMWSFDSGRVERMGCRSSASEDVGSGDGKEWRTIHLLQRDQQ